MDQCLANWYLKTSPKHQSKHKSFSDLSQKREEHQNFPDSLFPFSATYLTYHDRHCLQPSLAPIRSSPAHQSFRSGTTKAIITPTSLTNNTTGNNGTRLLAHTMGMVRMSCTRWAVLTGLHDAMAILFVSLQFDPYEDWPPLFEVLQMGIQFNAFGTNSGIASFTAYT
jgi:hypothetical protein